MKRIVLVLLGLCLIGMSYSQIENEISAYVDSTEILVKNGRKLLAESLENNDMEKVAQIYEYLSKLIDDENCSAFTFTEELYLTALTSKWTRWTELAKLYPEYSRTICYANVYYIDGFLYAEIKEKTEDLSRTLLLMDTEDKELIRLYLLLLKEGEMTELYIENYKQFKSRFPDSEYDAFLNSYLPAPKSKGSFGFSMGTSVLFPTNNLAELFSPNATFIMSMDINLGKVYTSLFFSGGGLFLDVPITVSSELENTEYYIDDRFAYFEAGFLAGYFLLRSERFHIAPYLTLAGGYLKSDIYEVDDDMEDFELDVFGSFITGGGLHTEINLYEWTPKSPYYYGNAVKSHISFKLDVGYNFIAKQNFEQLSGNFFYIRPTLVWGIGDF